MTVKHIALSVKIHTPAWTPIWVGRFGRMIFTRFGLFRANAGGFRANRNYALEPSYGITRIATFGNSFTHCTRVSNENTWQNFMEAFCPRLEVINFEVAAYGTNQTYLRFRRDRIKYQPHIVLIGLMLENINRNVSSIVQISCTEQI